jgi:hypothetical protein
MFMTNRRRRVEWIGWATRAVITCGLLTGCGSDSPRVAVDGQVTFEGQPLASGQIAFIPLGAESAPTAGATISEGRYQIPAEQGPFPGEHRVEIRAYRSTGKKVWDGMGDENAPATQKRYVEELEQYLPRIYNDESTLRVTITGPKKDQHDFALRASSASAPRR